MKHVIIDTDPGIDDTAAIFLALASPELSVDALTTVYGNGSIEACTRNALTILETAGRRDIPVYQGVSKPLLGTPLYAPHVHGSDALGEAGIPPPTSIPQARHAVHEMIERVLALPGEITLIALGPLTNIALALSLEPCMANALAELIVMGGAVLTHGNVTEVATANIYNDPEAAAIVYQSGAPLVQVGMNVCLKAAIPEEHLERMRQTPTPTMQLLTRITPYLRQSYAERGLRPLGTGVHYNDVPAMAYAIAPDLYEVREYHVRIATHDEITRGQTVADVINRWGRPPNARVLMEVRASQLADLFTTRVVGYTSSADLLDQCVP
jgi:inosine-uridine nucleoside N-ribohydrolase